MNINTTNHEYSTTPFLVLSTIGAGREAWQAGKVRIFCLLCFVESQSQMFQKVESVEGRFSKWF